MKTHKFARKPFYVDAVRVSEANIEEVATWCGGKIETDEQNRQFIRINAHRPLNDRQTQAFPTDWVLSGPGGFKAYQAKAFDKSFEKVRTLSKEQADAAGITVPHEPRSNAKPIHGNKEQGIQLKRQVPKPRPPKRKPANPVLSPEAARKLREANKKAEQPDVDYRSAKTGQYVTEEEAKANPDTTVAEVEPDKATTSTGKVIDTETAEVAETELPVEKKSKADVEAEKLIDDIRKEIEEV